MANETGRPTVQDKFLSELRKNKIPVTIHIVNGYQLNGIIILGYDSFVITVEAAGKPMMIYKHAISTISPEKKAEETN